MTDRISELERKLEQMELRALRAENRFHSLTDPKCSKCGGTLYISSSCAPCRDKCGGLGRDDLLKHMGPRT